MEDKVFIYALVDPRTNEIRYVGFAKNIESRYREHIRETKRYSTHKVNWLKQLLRNGLEPIRVFLDEVPAEDWSLCESAWIVYGLEQGWPLTNMTLGGDGCLGRRHSEKTKLRISLSNKGRQSLEGTKNPFYGKRHNEVTKRRISNKLSGENGVNAKLDSQEVVEIRKLYKTGNYSGADLGRLYNISRSQIYKIVSGKQWNCVK